MTDRFALYDEEGNEICEKQLLGHIQTLLVENNMLKGENENKKYRIVSLVSGYELQVTKDTSLDDFREFNFKCEFALD